MVTGCVEVSTRVVAAQIVSPRANCAGVIDEIRAGASRTDVQYRVSDGKRGDAKIAAIGDDAAALGGPSCR